MKGSKLSVLFQLILILLVKPTFQRRFVQSACNKNDRDSLLEFSLNLSSSAKALNWSSSADCCLWEGVYCDVVGGGGGDRVTRLWLPFRGLRAISRHLSQTSLISPNSICHIIPSLILSLPISFRRLIDLRSLT